jgi:hypothetical protein
MTERRPVLRRTRPSRPARVARRAKGTDEHELILSTLEPNETPREATADFAKVSVEGADLITGTRGERAIQAFQEAANLDAIPRLSHGDEIVYAMEAEKARAKAQALLQLTDPVRLAAGEVIGGDHRIVDTLESPEAISAGASSRRMHAALEVGVLEPAADAAKTAQAANSIERMLCHGITAAHFMAMRLYKATQDCLECLPYQQQQFGEVARLTNAVARQLEIYQTGCLTLQKPKTGGRQQVLVQHQQVNVGSRCALDSRLLSETV